MHIRIPESDDDFVSIFPLIVQLRPHLSGLSPAEFLERIRGMRAGGYELAAAYVDDRPVVVAGFRVAETLVRGPHLFVDDLVTDEAGRGRGHGKAMIGWLRAEAGKRGLPKVWLDSRAAARGFYEHVGFTMHTSIPCWIDAERGEGSGEFGRTPHVLR